MLKKYVCLYFIDFKVGESILVKFFKHIVLIFKFVIGYIRHRLDSILANITLNILKL